MTHCVRGSGGIICYNDIEHEVYAWWIWVLIGIAAIIIAICVIKGPTSKKECKKFWCGWRNRDHQDENGNEVNENNVRIEIPTVAAANFRQQFQAK